MKRFILLLFILLFSKTWLSGQRDSSIVIFTDCQEIPPDRYRGARGTPFLFEEYVLATVVSSNIDVYEGVWVNYNGYTKGFEALRDNRFVELNERWYLRVEIDPEVNPGLIKDFGREKLVFQRGIHPKLENLFANVIYAGLRTVFFKIYQADLSKQKVENPGQTVEFQRFAGSYTYYLLKEGQLEPLSLRKKSFMKALGKGKALENFAVENDIDFNSEKDLIRLVEFYDKNL